MENNTCNFMYFTKNELEEVLKASANWVSMMKKEHKYNFIICNVTVEADYEVGDWTVSIYYTCKP